MQRSLSSLLLALLAALALSVLLIAQATSTFEGFAKDTSGGVLPGVLVKIAGPALAHDRSAMTDEKGFYRFADIPAGKYEVTAELAGFQTVRIVAVVEAGLTRTVSLTLRLAAVSETVTVSSVAPAVDVQNAASVTSLERQVVDNFPAGSNIWEMAQAIPGIAGAPGSYVSQHGQAAAGNVVVVDGMSVGGLEGPLSAYFNRPGGHPTGTEAYERLADNQWLEVSRRPLSTFSIDVDTASYANVRRLLNQGQAPPKDSVRIEELINYFSYDYPEPRDGAPFSVTTSIGDCPWDPHHRLALIGLQARRLNSENTPPRNLVFLLDVSGSMDSPQKLPLVKASLALLARNLTRRDRISIVVYAGSAGLVLPATAGNDISTILEALNRLQAGGSTNGGDGLHLAYRIARQQFLHEGVNRVIIATDGDFNVGVTNPDDLVRLVEEHRASGVTLSVLGFGMGNLKDSTMEELADKGNGNYSYIDSLQEAQKVLVQEAGGTFVTVAKDVKLQIEFNPDTVVAYRLIGYENRLLRDRDFNDDRVDAGDMGAGHSVTALYELIPAGSSQVPGIDSLRYQPSRRQPAKSIGDELMTVKLRYKQPQGHASSLISKAVPAKISMTPNLGFAAAVAQFGMLLRDSQYKGTASWQATLALAIRHKGDDPYGHRAEFIRLVGVADGLSTLQAAGRRTRW